MTSLHAWATRNNIPLAALLELQQVLGLVPYTPPAPTPPGGEAAVQAAVRLEAARRGYLLFRNNTGVLPDKTGRPVRYGLANDSPQANAVCKSSDLIGIGPSGQFVAFECKAPGWKFYESDKRAMAQLAFIKLVVARGGVAKFVTKMEDIP